MGLILSADFGTTNLKAGLVDGRGNVLATESRPAKVMRPEPGAAEHDAEALWRDFCLVTRKLARGRERRITAVSTSAYQLAIMAADSRLRPLTGMMTLLDTRPQSTYADMVRRIDHPRLYRITGLPLFSQCPLAKLYWLRHRRPALFRRARYWLNIKDFIMHRMTGELAAELSLATATQMMDFRRHRWDPYALAIAGAKESQFPPIVAGDRVLGRLTARAADAMGLRAGLPVVPGVYDGGALTLGIGGLVPHVATVNLGTTTMFRTSVTRPVIDAGPMMRLHTNAFLDGVWVTGAGVNNAGNTVAWFMRTFSVKSYRELEALAGKARRDVPPPVMFPYLTGERAPYIGSKATGAFWDLKDHHGGAEMARAMLTGIGYTLKFIQEGVRETGTRVSEVRSGGGGAHMDLWLGILAGIFDLPVRRPVGENPSLVGNALIAHVALRRYAGIVEATRAMVRLGTIVRPARAEVREHAAGFRRFADLLGRLRGGW